MPGWHRKHPGQKVAVKTMNGSNGFLKLSALAKMKMPIQSPLSYPVISQSEHRHPLASQSLADGPHNFVRGVSSTPTQKNSCPWSCTFSRVKYWQTEEQLETDALSQPNCWCESCVDLALPSLPQSPLAKKERIQVESIQRAPQRFLCPLMFQNIPKTTK